MCPTGDDDIPEMHVVIGKLRSLCSVCCQVRFEWPFAHTGSVLSVVKLLLF
jgi:hypothetical protein